MIDQNGDDIFRDRNALLPDYVPEDMPNRAGETLKIKKLILDSLKGHTTHVLVHGRPGTGKTDAIKSVFNNLKKETDALFCYVNCFNKNTKVGILHSIVMDFFREKRPTRRMPSRRGIAYDEIVESLQKELEKTNTKVVVCLDEVDKLKENEVIYDLLRARLNNCTLQIIAVSNDPLVFMDLDPRISSRLYPLKEIFFRPYNLEEMRDILEAKVQEAFHEGAIEKEVVEYLASFTVEKKGDVRIARETLRRAGELVRESGSRKIEIQHIEKILNKSQHAGSLCRIAALSYHERFILNLIPKSGAYFPEICQLYRSIEGALGDRMIRNYMDRFHRLNLISMEKKGVGGSYFITLNTPKEALFELS